MDGDPAVESRLDSFSLTFPLPYRVAFIIILGVWGWAVNLHYLYLVHIDVPSLIRYPQRSSGHQPPHHRSAYRLAAFLSASFAASLLPFWLLTRRDPQLVLDYDWWPMTYLAVLAALFVLPLRNLAVSHAGRGRLLRTLRRVSVGGLAEARDGKFGDILLADVLTSYARVLADLFVCVCMFLARGGSATDRPDRGCGGAVVVPAILALPSLLRLRQCLIEYVRARRAGGKGAGQHLANAAKYASAFPVVVFAALQRSGPQQQEGENALDSSSTTTTGAYYHAWVFSLLVNSLYSFYWDVAKDWDLTLFSDARERNAPEHPFGLRRRLLLHGPAVYYAVIALDLMLRCTWVVRLSPGRGQIADFESSVFLMQFLEVFRRWVWIFFRVEAEWLRNTSTGLGMEDILLGDYQGGGSKYEDEED